MNSRAAGRSKAHEFSQWRGRNGCGCSRTQAL